jgi:hypothetical protein
VPAVSAPLYPDTTTVCDVASADSTTPCHTAPAPTFVADCFGGTEPDITSPCATTTTELDPTNDGPTCTPDAGDGVECALTGFEQQYPVVAGDSLVSIARRYGISVDILIAYNQWPDGVDHVLFPGDIVLIPPFAADADSSATTTTSIITVKPTLEP